MVRSACAAIRAVHAVATERDGDTPAAIDGLPDLHRRWRNADGPRLIGSAVAAIVDQAFTTVREADTRSVVCHGDTNPGNLLAAQREPWLLIDPLPIRADPAYDAVSLVWSKRPWLLAQPDPQAIIRRRIGIASGEIDVPAERIHAWTTVRLAGMIGQRATWGGWDQDDLFATLRCLAEA
jgi:streptomycin 6-kinase